MYLQYAVLLLVVLATTAWPPPNDGGWATVTDQVFPPTVAMPIRPSALVDWNNDEFIDLIGIGNGDSNQGASTLMIYEWQTSNNSFALSYTSEARTLPGGYPDPISNVVAADMNRDGRNDIVLLTASGALWIWDGASNNMSLVGNTSLPADVIQGSSPQLSVLSVYGVCALLDIVVTTSSGDLYVLQNDASGASCDFVGGPVSFTPHRIAGNVAPLSVLVADIYGTCNSELIFGVLPTAGSDVMTYYRFDSVGGQMVQLFEVPQYAGLPVAMDVNADGAVDFVFPYCTSTDTACRNGNSDFSAMLFVYSNMVGQACGAYDCCTGFGASFASVTSGVDDGAGFTVIAIQGMYEGLTSLTRSSATNAAATLPLVIRAGDYNRDSYPDFVIATNAGAALFSRVNGGLTPPQFAVQLFDPTSTDGIPFFFDLEEDGRLDVLVVHPSSTDVGLGLSAYWNGMTMHENYFLTAVILNGVNVGEATVDRPAPPGVNFPARGTTQVGSVHRFQWQDIETNLRTQGYTQQGSTQAHALGNPRVHFGLGRTFSYIQNYAAGIHIAQSAVSLHNTWPSYLIPNSQVVVIPYPLDDPSNWMIKLFLSSSKYQTLLIISLSTALAVIGVPIVILKYREMREDLAEMKRHA